MALTLICFTLPWRFVSAIESFPTLSQLDFLADPLPILLKVLKSKTNSLFVAWRGVAVKRLQPAKFFSKGQAAVSFTSGTTYQAPNSRSTLRLEQVVILEKKQDAEARVVGQKQKTDERKKYLRTIYLKSKHKRSPIEKEARC